MLEEENLIDTILEFCDDKTIETFECLKVYFRNLTIKQIQYQIEELYIEYNDLINMVKPRDKIIMCVFINQYLKPYLNITPSKC